MGQGLALAGFDLRGKLGVLLINVGVEGFDQFGVGDGVAAGTDQSR